jgi:ubiquinone/menaquinone biosynthesis C-methylase UbiE
MPIFNDVKAVVAAFTPTAHLYDTVSDYHRRDIPPFIESASLKEGEHVLDLGTGTGWVIIAAKRCVGEGVVVGVDCVPAMLAGAQRNITEAGLLDQAGGIVLGDMLDPSSLLAAQRFLPDGSPGFDVITCLWAFSNLPPQKQPEALRMWATWLAPGGRLVIEIEFSKESPAVFVQSRPNPSLPSPPGLTCAYEVYKTTRMAVDEHWAASEAEVRALAQQCGLEVVSTHQLYDSESDVDRAGDLEDRARRNWERKGRPGDFTNHHVRFLQKVAMKWQETAMGQGERGNWKKVGVTAVLKAQG